MEGPPKKTQEAIEELNQVQVFDKKTKEMKQWESINQLFKYCQEKRKQRLGKRGHHTRNTRDSSNSE